MTYVYIHAAQSGLVRILSLYLTYLRSCYPPLYRVTKILSWRALFHSLFRHWHNRIQTFTSHVNVRDGRLFGCYLFYKDREWQKSLENNWPNAHSQLESQHSTCAGTPQFTPSRQGCGPSRLLQLSATGWKSCNKQLCVRACVRAFVHSHLTVLWDRSPATKFRSKDAWICIFNTHS